jgi:hypothetical protein
MDRTQGLVRLGNEASNREDLERDVREFLYTRLDSEWKSGKWSLDELSKFLENLARRPSNIAHLALVYHLFRSGGAEEFFIRELPEDINRLSHDIRRERTVSRRVGRGHIRWSETVMRQQVYSDPTIFCTTQAVKEYDTPSNRLLAHYLRDVWNSLDTITGSSRSRLAVRSNVVSRIAQEALRSAYLRQARSVTSVSSSMLAASQRSKTRIYWRAAGLWQELEQARDTRDIGRLRDILSTGWLAPLAEDDLFEIYVLVRVLRVLEYMLCENQPDRVRYDVMAVSEGPVATFSGVHWAAEVWFDTAPHNAFGAVFSSEDYKYKNLLAQYSVGMAAARRPDICISLSQKSDGLIVPLIVEVKNTSANSQYARDSLYKMLGYLSDFDNLWSGNRSAVRPKAALVLRDGVTAINLQSALREEIVLLSPPGLTQNLMDFISASFNFAKSSSVASAS